MNVFIFIIGLVFAVISMALMLYICNTDMTDKNMRAPIHISKEFKIRACSCQTIGTRTYQQDRGIITSESNRYFLKHNGLLCAVCDGMGGMEMGEFASGICADTLYNDFTKSKCRILQPIQLLKTAVQKADESVSGFTDSKGNRLRCGTTAVAAVIKDKKFHWISVGDSRIYLYEKGVLRQLTRDHNYLLELEHKVREGRITMDEALNHPKAEALISYVGMHGIKLIDSAIVDFDESDNRIFILCSDGLYKALSNIEIAEILRDCGNNTEVIPQQLISAVEQKAQHRSLDNTTVIAVGYGQA